MLGQFQYYLGLVNEVRVPGAILALTVGILLALFGVVHRGIVLGGLALVALLFTIASIVGGAPHS